MTTSSSPNEGQHGQMVARPRGAEAARSASQIKAPLGSALQTYSDAWDFAVAVAQAETLPDALRGKVPDIFLNVTYGAELGLSPMQSFRAINVIKGTPSLSGDYLITRVRQYGHKFEIVSSSRSECTTRITRGDTGQAQEWTYTIEEAANAGLCSITDDGTVRARSRSGERLPWETATRKMLLWRSTSNNVDSICPEVAFGYQLADGSDLAAEADTAPPATPPAAANLAEAASARETKAADAKRIADGLVADVREQEITDAEVVETPEAPPPAQEETPPSAEELAEIDAEHTPGAEAPEPEPEPETTAQPEEQCPGCGAYGDAHADDCPTLEIGPADPRDLDEFDRGPAEPEEPQEPLWPEVKGPPPEPEPEQPPRGRGKGRR